MPPDELTLQHALEMLDKAVQSDEPLGVCPQTQEPIFLKVGRFGPYVQRGTGEGDQKPQNASLLKGMSPEDVTLEVALKLLSLPRTLGDHPALGQPVVAYNGRYGPYVKCGEETRSLPNGLSPLDVTFEQALELLAQPKAARGGAARKEVLKVLGPSPVTEKPVQLLAGRYGPYVADGATNASLPRGTTVDEVTLEYALNLLKARAERGPSAWAGRRRRGDKSAAGPTAKAAAKKVPKKTAKKKAPQEGRPEKDRSEGRACRGLTAGKPIEPR